MAASTVWNNLRRLRDALAMSTSAEAFHGYLTSLLGYGLVVWGNSMDVNKLWQHKKMCTANVWFGTPRVV